MHALRAADLASMLGACVELRLHAPPACAEPLIASTQGGLKALPPRTLPALLADLQALLPAHFVRSSPAGADPRVSAWLAQYMQQCLDRLPLLTAAGVVDVLAAVSRSGVAPGAAWMSSFVGACVCLHACMHVSTLRAAHALRIMGSVCQGQHVPLLTG